MKLETKTHIRSLLAGLFQSPHNQLGQPVIEIAASRWMVRAGENFIVQFELLHHADKAIMYSTIARDGSGPLKASFLTMLLLEDTIASVQQQYGVCSGAASVTMYRFLDLADMNSERLAAVLANFASLNEIVFADYVLPPLMDSFADEHETA